MDKEKWIFVNEFDKLSSHIEKKINRGIEEHRQGLFMIKVVDEKGAPVENAKVTAKQISHEFKFGCTSFMLGQFKEEEKNKKWEEEYLKLFNYTVAPLYWLGLEPKEGEPRFSKDSENVYRRPALDAVHEWAKENNLRVKGHCLMYNSFQPGWIPKTNRELKMAVEERSQKIAERYGKDYVDLDVINEQYLVYKNAYGEGWPRNYSITDEDDHEKWCFDVAKKYFPHSRLFWNEGCYETFGFEDFKGNKSRYYLMLKKWIEMGAPIEGIGMQFHVFRKGEEGLKDNLCVYNPLRTMELMKVYSEFNLPIHISEITIPSYSNEPEDEEIQAELTKRMYKLWFSQEKVDSIVWWNMVDGTAMDPYENGFHGGLLRNDLSRKPSFDALNKLINEEWKTEICEKSADNGRVAFEGFYGDYEITVETDGKKLTEVMSFYKENTGYHHDIATKREYNLKEKKIVMK